MLIYVYDGEISAQLNDDKLINAILRNEWSFDGLVMTDLSNHASHCKEILAGNDIGMPCNAPSDLTEAFENGKYTEKVISTKQNVTCLVGG